MKNQRKISNPLTIIAIFAGLAEINGTIVLSLVPSDLQEIFLWFIILFPSILVLVFFSILNWNPSVLYAPSDFLNDESFLKLLNKNTGKFNSTNVNINETNYNDTMDFNDIVQKQDTQNFNKDPFLEETKAHLNLANRFFNRLQELNRKNFDLGFLSMLSFGVQAPEYFLMSFKINEDIMPGESGRSGDTIIIRVTEDKFGNIVLIALGKDIIEQDHNRFAERLLEYVQDFINTYGDKNKIEKRIKKNDF